MKITLNWLEQAIVKDFEEKFIWKKCNTQIFDIFKTLWIHWLVQYSYKWRDNLNIRERSSTVEWEVSKAFWSHWSSAPKYDDDLCAFTISKLDLVKDHSFLNRIEDLDLDENEVKVFSESPDWLIRNITEVLSNKNKFIDRSRLWKGKKVNREKMLTALDKYQDWIEWEGDKFRNSQTKAEKTAKDHYL